MSKSKNSNLYAAQAAKNDEFYTLLADIENEMRYYREYFAGKTVYLNCDDPRESQFFRFFVNQFHSLGLKKLISTGYRADGHGSSELAHGVKCVYSGDNNVEIEIIELEGTGGFETSECIELLKDADIVVSNPPFSKFREYVSLLVEYNKKFIIIGNVNAITYKTIFPLIKNNKLWLGVTSPKEFTVPEGYTAKNVVNGVAKFGNIGWFTNLNHYRRNEELIIWKEYNEEEYPKYDNYDAINVDRVKDIPNYDGIMGVPITFMNKYNPEQFEIIGVGIANLGLEIGIKPYKPEHKKYRKEVQKRGAADGDLYMMVGGVVTVPYTRILIRRRQSIP